MIGKLSLPIALALVALVAAPSASFAASKKSEHSDKAKCLGGGCTAQNPDRERDPFQSSYYKKNKKKKTGSTTNN